MLGLEVLGDELLPVGLQALRELTGHVVDLGRVVDRVGVHRPQLVHQALQRGREGRVRAS